MLVFTLQVALERSEEAVHFYQLIFNANLVQRFPHIIESNFTGVIGQTVYLAINHTTLAVVNTDNFVPCATFSHSFPAVYLENADVVAAMLHGDPNVQVLEDRAFSNSRVITFIDPFGFSWRVASVNLQPVLPPH